MTGSDRWLPPRFNPATPPELRLSWLDRSSPDGDYRDLKPLPVDSPTPTEFEDVDSRPVVWPASGLRRFCNVIDGLNGILSLLEIFSSLS